MTHKFFPHQHLQPTPPTEKVLTFSSKNWSQNLLLISWYITRTIQRQNCMHYIHWGQNCKKCGRHFELQITTSRIPADFLGASASQSCSKYVIYDHNKRLGCSSNGIFKIIATKIETDHISPWPAISWKIYAATLTWTLNQCPNLVVAQELEYLSKFIQQKQFCFSLG